MEDTDPEPHSAQILNAHPCSSACFHTRNTQHLIVVASANYGRLTTDKLTDQLTYWPFDSLSEWLTDTDD